MEEAAGPPVEGQRRVRLGPSAANGGFPGNSVRTSKYNIVTFLPIFLFTMFSRVAYLYFAAQVRPPEALFEFKNVLCGLGCRGMRKL